MKIEATVNGLAVTLEIKDRDFAIAALLLEPPEDLNQLQAAAFCHVSPRTFRNWNVPKNQNGRYSVALLRARMNTSRRGN